MAIVGQIRPTGLESGLTFEAWCLFIASRPEFRRPPSREARNPFTGTLMFIHPTQDVAEVVLGERVIGSVYWSLSEEPLVNVAVESEGLPFVCEWAAVLGGEFHIFPQEGEVGPDHFPP